MVVSLEAPANEKALKMLAMEFPPRYQTLGKDKWVSTVCETQSTKMDITSVANDIRMTLLQRVARRRPLCHVREDVLNCTAKELLRQVRLPFIKNTSPDVTFVLYLPQCAFNHRFNASCWSVILNENANVIYIN